MLARRVLGQVLWTTAATPIQNPWTLFRRNCPVCNDEGKFIMSDREANSLGRILALVLGIPKSSTWTWTSTVGSTPENSEAIGNQRRHYHWLRGWHFEAIANRADEKADARVENGMIGGNTVSIELDLDLPTDDIPEVLYFPCEGEEVKHSLSLD